MSFFDRLKKGWERAQEEVGEFTQVTRIRGEISKLREMENAKLVEIGRRVYDQHSQGIPVSGFEAQCQEIDQIEADIKQRQVDIDRIQGAEAAAAAPPGAPGGSSPAAAPGTTAPGAAAPGSATP